MADLDLFDLGEEIRQSRRFRKLTQQQVADMAGVTRSHILAIEAGRAPTVAFRTILHVMRCVGLDLRSGTYNYGRPTLDDLREQNEREEAAEREALRRSGRRAPRF